MDEVAPNERPPVDIKCLAPKPRRETHMVPQVCACWAKLFVTPFYFHDLHQSPTIWAEVPELGIVLSQAMFM